MAKHLYSQQISPSSLLPVLSAHAHNAASTRACSPPTFPPLPILCTIPLFSVPGARDKKGRFHDVIRCLSMAFHAVSLSDVAVCVEPFAGPLHLSGVLGPSGFSWLHEGFGCGCL